MESYESDWSLTLHILLTPSWYPQDEADLNGLFFREQAEAMANSGHNIGVLALNVDPIYAKNHHAERPFILKDEKGLAVLRGSVTFLVPLHRWVNVKLARRRLFKAWDTYVQANGVPDVIHAHSLFPGAYFAAELSRKYGVPYVYTEHRTLNHLKTRTPWARHLERRVARTAASRHAVSKGHAAHLEARFGISEWTYTPNLLPLDSVGHPNLQSPKPGPGHLYRFGHLSVLDPVKGVDLLIEAFSKVYEDDKSVRLLIAGSGVEEANLRKHVSELGLDGAVQFLGKLDRRDVADFFSKIDCFILPSYSETMGIVQIEALSAGVPVIASRTWGAETVIDSEADGVLVNIGDIEGLTEAMNQMRTRSESPQEINDRRERCIQRFGTDSFVSRYNQIYSEALEKRH